MKLNSQQQAVVEAPLCNALVLAGAGTGKTRVLVERIAHLLRMGIAPNCIMAISFNRKAASEIRSRLRSRFVEIDPLYGEAYAHNITNGTFHSVFSQILRQFIELVPGLEPGFSIIDPESSKALLRRLVKERGWGKTKLDEIDKSGADLKLTDIISNAKENYISVGDFTIEHFHSILSKLLKVESEQDLSAYSLLTSESFYHKVRVIYELYELNLSQNNSVDFSDLLLKPLQLFTDNPKVKFLLQQKFKYIIVDECQDMNLIQYKLVEALHNPEQNNVCLIGDDDQSIYGFRGADVSLIQQYQKNFPNVTTYKLEENYRCSPNIIKAANLIINKYKRISNPENIKVLKASKASSANQKINVHYANFSYYDELIETIERQAKVSGYNSILVISRVNNSLNTLDQRLSQTNIPYTRLTGVKFFDKREIKVILSYLRLIINRNDNISFEYCVEHPKAGIGAKTLEKIRAGVGGDRKSYFDVIEEMIRSGDLKGATANKVQAFVDKIEQFKGKYLFESLDVIIDKIIKDFKLEQFWRDKEPSKAEERIQRMYDLVELAENYEENEELDLDEKLKDDELATLEKLYPVSTLEQREQLLRHMEFINSNTLNNSDQEQDVHELQQLDADQERITLSTIHGVKGLEFEHVHIIDVNDAIIPSPLSETIAEYEEERRLMYVAITRAKETLDLWYSKCYFGNDRQPRATDVSIYLKEMAIWSEQDPDGKIFKATVEGNEKPLFFATKTMSESMAAYKDDPRYLQNKAENADFRAKSANSNNTGKSNSNYKAYSNNPPSLNPNGFGGYSGSPTSQPDPWQQRTSSSTGVNSEVRSGGKTPEWTNDQSGDRIKSQMDYWQGEDFVPAVGKSDLASTPSTSTPVSATTSTLTQVARDVNGKLDPEVYKFKSAESHFGGGMERNVPKSDTGDAVTDQVQVEDDLVDILDSLIADKEILVEEQLQKDLNKLHKQLDLIASDASRSQRLSQLTYEQYLNYIARNPAEKVFEFTTWASSIKYTQIDGFKDWLALAVKYDLILHLSELFSAKTYLYGEILASELGKRSIINRLFARNDINFYSNNDKATVVVLWGLGMHWLDRQLLYCAMMAFDGLTELFEAVSVHKISSEKLFNRIKERIISLESSDAELDKFCNNLITLFTNPFFLREVDALAKVGVIKLGLDLESIYTNQGVPPLESQNQRQCAFELENLHPRVITELLYRVDKILKDPQQTVWNPRYGFGGLSSGLPALSYRSDWEPTN